MTIALHEKPLQSRHVSLRARRPDGSVTVATPHGDVVELNQTAAALWSLCDGQTSVQEIVIAATSLFEGPPESIRLDIVTILDELQHMGLLDTGR